ncbi:MAG TPA: MauE/DoxX family redox-associated membrane protein [Nevskiaceae bacterium]|nr:MauE/DoxX family redox-associated membrane protein [Nevskiaceae bacterium]
MAVAALILRALLSLILARAAWHKWRDRAQFVEQIRGYRLLPDPIVAPMAIALTLAETIASLALLNPAWSAPAVVAAGLFTLYAAAMAINLARGIAEIDCGCGGPLGAQTTIHWILVLRNALLTAAALFIFATPVPALPLAQWLIVLSASVATALLYEAVEQAIANRQQVTRWRASWKH